MPNPFEHALNQVSRTNVVHPFPEAFLEKVQTPDHVLEATVDLEKDDGSHVSVPVYRVQFNNARGPYKGGIRFHQETDLHEVKALAFWMSLKTAVANIPMGGGKGGATINPKELSKTELERLARGWVRAFVDHIGPHKDVPAPDVNTTPEIMDWMADEFEKLTGDTTRATFTGKPLGKGGSEGRGKATAQGGFYVFNALRAPLGLPESCSVAIQGFGNAGAIAAELWEDAGHRIVGLSDSRSAVSNPEGIDVAAAAAYKKAHGSLEGLPGAQRIAPDELLALDCDVLIPAALENQLREDNAASVRAKVVLELANGPTTPQADDLFFANGIPVIPDILANAGGVTVSTFEWEQNLSGEHWSEEEVNRKLKTIIEREAQAIFEQAKVLKTDLRRAAFVIALERLQAAMA